MSVDKLECFCGFFFRGSALIGDRVGREDWAALVDSFGKGVGHVQSETVIPESESLERSCRVSPFGCGERCVRQVEVAQDIHDTRTGILVVHRPAIGLWSVLIQREVGADIVAEVTVKPVTGAAHGLHLEFARHC